MRGRWHPPVLGTCMSWPCQILSPRVQAWQTDVPDSPGTRVCGCVHLLACLGSLRDCFWKSPIRIETKVSFGAANLRDVACIASRIAALATLLEEHPSAVSTRISILTTASRSLGENGFPANSLLLPHALAWTCQLPRIGTLLCSADNNGNNWKKC